MTPLVSRGFGEIELFQTVLPDPALTLFVLLTWLGSMLLLVPVLVFVYWFYARDVGAFALAAILGGFALMTALKAMFGLPRPPMELWLVTAPGSGFPSGHAISATVGWGSLAVALTWRTRRQRMAIAGLVIAVVGLSRVAIGVHYAVDVIAGIAIGVTYLGVLLLLGDATRAFSVAVVASLAAVIASGGSDLSLLLLGGTVAGAVTVAKLSMPVDPWDTEELLPATGIGVVLSGLVALGYYGVLPSIIVMPVGALAVGGILAAPVVYARVSGQESLGHYERTAR